MVDNTKSPSMSKGFTNVVMVPNSSNLADGIITSNSTTIAIHKLSDSRAGGSGSIPRPPTSPRTLTTPSSSSAITSLGTIQKQQLTVQTLPRKLGHHSPQTDSNASVAGASSGSVTLESLGDSIQTLGRGRPHLPLPSILVSSTSSNSGRSSVEPNPSASVSSSSRRSSNISEFRLSSALNALDLDNLDLRNIDPSLASKLLSEIRNGADLGPLLEKLKSEQQQSNNPSKSGDMKKVVTFEDDVTKPGMPGKPSPSEDEILKVDDVFM